MQMILQGEKNLAKKKDNWLQLAKAVQRMVLYNKHGGKRNCGLENKFNKKSVKSTVKSFKKVTFFK